MKNVRGPGRRYAAMAGVAVLVGLGLPVVALVGPAFAGTVTAGSSTTISSIEGSAFSGQVATFTDSDTAKTPADFTASINWGDGTAVTGGSVGGSAGHYTVSGNHTYAEDGLFTGTATLTENVGGGHATATFSETGKESTLTATGANFTVIEGTAFNGTTGTFTDPGSSDPVNAFTGSINWGDGSPITNGTVTGSAGSYAVSGNHTYADDGSYTVTTTFFETIDLGFSINVSSTATVRESTLSMTGTTIHPTEGTSFSGAVATFSDPNSPDPASAFTANISWGDGTPVTPGTVTGSSGSYTVSGNHTYADEGSFSVTVTAFENVDSTFNISATGTATVAEGDALTPGPVTINAHHGTPFTGTVATFTDAFAGNTAGDFTATIDWGDGTTTPGTVAASGANYTVSGTHTYANPGLYHMHVTLADDAPGTATATANSTANVDAADLSVTKTGPAKVTPGTNISYTITAHNAGPQDATNVTVSDTIPAGTTFVSSTQTSGPAFTCTTPPVGGTGTESCTIATFTAGATSTFTVVVHASPAASGTTAANTATIASPTGFDPNPANNSSSVSTALTCDHVINGTSGSITASGGSWCFSGRIAGSITVTQGTTAVINNATVVNGGVSATAPAGFSMCNSTIPSLSVSGATGFVLVGDPGDDLCPGNTINGSVNLSGNHAGVEVSHNGHIGGGVTFNNNAGGGPFPEDAAPELEANTITGSLTCSGNVPAPTNDGQANHSAGVGTGQCIGF